MAFKAKLNFSGGGYSVLYSSYSLNRLQFIPDTSVVEALVNNADKPLAGNWPINISEEDAKVKAVY